MRWPLAQVDGEQGEHAGSTHGAHPHPPSTSNSQDSPQHLGTSESPPPLSRHILSFATAQHVPQLHEHSLGGGSRGALRPLTHPVQTTHASIALRPQDSPKPQGFSVISL